METGRENDGTKKVIVTKSGKVNEVQVRGEVRDDTWNSHIDQQAVRNKQMLWTRWRRDHLLLTADYSSRVSHSQINRFGFVFGKCPPSDIRNSLALIRITVSVLSCAISAEPVRGSSPASRQQEGWQWHLEMSHWPLLTRGIHILSPPFNPGLFGLCSPKRFSPAQWGHSGPLDESLGARYTEALLGEGTMEGAISGLPVI